MKKTITLFTVLFFIFICTASCTTDHPSIDDTPSAHKCDSICELCGKCTDEDCDEEICRDKCNGHVELPEISVDDLK